MFIKKGETPADGFEDNYKHDPVLRALAQGRIYNPSSPNEHMQPGKRAAAKPSAFWLLISKGPPGGFGGRYEDQGDLLRDQNVLHRYSGLVLQPRSHERLDNIHNWRDSFPALAETLSRHPLRCDIIHMDVSLNLMRTHAPDGSELVSRSEMIIPGQSISQLSNCILYTSKELV